MEQITYIYTLSHPVTGEVRYVGKTVDTKKREAQHCSPNHNKRSHRGNWITSLLNQGLFPEMQVIDVVEGSEWAFWERHYISLFRSWGFSLVNATIGGEGNTGMKHSEETKRKIREITTGKRASEATKEKMKKSSPRYWAGKRRPETGLKVSIALTGKKLSEDRKIKMSERMSGPNHHFYGKNLTEDHKKNLWATRSRGLSDQARKNVSDGIKEWWRKRKEAKCLTA